MASDQNAETDPGAVDASQPYIASGGFVSSRKQDEHYLDIAGLFFYVVAGIMSFIALFPAIHIVIGILALTGVMDDTQTGEKLPVFFGVIFVAMGATVMLVGQTMALCVAIAGRRIRQRRSHTFCLVIAGIVCMCIPVGTILGVLTIMLLVRPPVKELFDANTR